MKIIRNEQEFELTGNELMEAHAEFVTNFMQKELLENFDVKEEDTRKIAESAYGRYCKGNGETEYECIEWAYEEYYKEKEF